MYSLKTFLMEVGGAKPSQIPSDKIFCIETNAESTLLTNLMKQNLDCFTFTLVRKGECTIDYNGKIIRLKPFDLYVYNPGLSVEILHITEDYQGICVFINNEAILDNQFASEFMRATYFPFVKNRPPRLTLPPELFRRLDAELMEIINYLNSDKLLKTEASLMLFSLFLIDLCNTQKISETLNASLSRSELLVIHFMQLLPANFIAHRDIDFYASRLNISKIYLSRIVKNITGKTIVRHIDELLAAHAEWQLKQTGRSIKEIADQMNFSDQASFCRFFKRMKGLSPTEFRRL